MKDKETIKVTLRYSGEPSIGIAGRKTTIDLDEYPDVFDGFVEGREVVRELLVRCFSNIWGGRVEAVFSDECIDCGKLKEDSDALTCKKCEAWQIGKDEQELKEEGASDE